MKKDEIKTNLTSNSFQIFKIKRKPDMIEENDLYNHIENIFCFNTSNGQIYKLIVHIDKDIQSEWIKWRMKIFNQESIGTYQLITTKYRPPKQTYKEEDCYEELICFDTRNGQIYSYSKNFFETDYQDWEGGRWMKWKMKPLKNF
jgi:hypothetical protein|tara:strand:+ start:80 stop:514 length:435 start_codon:yes stop_codon:yes gene_type:complete